MHNLNKGGLHNSGAHLFFVSLSIICVLEPERKAKRCKRMPIGFLLELIAHRKPQFPKLNTHARHNRKAPRRTVVAIRLPEHIAALIFNVSTTVDCAHTNANATKQREFIVQHMVVIAGKHNVGGKEIVVVAHQRFAHKQILTHIQSHFKRDLLDSITQLGIQVSR